MLAVERELLPRFRRAFFETLKRRNLSMRSAAALMGIHAQTVLSWSRRTQGPSPAMQVKVLQVFPEVADLFQKSGGVEVLDAVVRRREITGENLRLVRSAATTAAIDVYALQWARDSLPLFWVQGPNFTERPSDHARELRTGLGLGVGSIAMIEDGLEQLGIPCVRTAGVAGAGATKVVVSVRNLHSQAPTELPVIVSWGAASFPDHRWNLAVEVGFLRTPATFGGRARLAAVEAFADEFLAPLAGLNQLLPVTGVARSQMDVRSLAHAFQVPVSVVERQFARANFRVTGSVDGATAIGFFSRVAQAQGAHWSSSQ